MGKERFVSGSLSRKRFKEIIQLFFASDDQLGDDRNQIKVVHHEGKKLVVKSFRKPNLVNRIVYGLIRKSKARRSYENACYLKDHQIGTPEPIAYLEQYTSIGLHTSYYVSDYAEHDFTFREIINDENLKDKNRILEQFAGFMYNMHEAGIYFLDHSPGNTLIKRDGDNYEFYLVDLNRMRFFDIPYEDRLKNFERLAPDKWIYEVMGTAYAKLSNADENETIDKMWAHTQRFQQSFHRKKRLKKKLKNILK
ncbi:lipopolysaccharide kinase InaA family protein [Nonlabens xiamenensis]|uniref:lipopolysaccharide kinase InaA family protein n=1 Tax=Nonlabens xiamenensis TaxID=2341043 RepID=UPI000F6134C8|nr:lipopolysaccharide kinase InaA family protein [Nonlabens xiamenensis]